MNAFDTELKRAFAEFDQPVDDGFSVAVTARVARRERLASAGAMGRQVAVGLACVALAFGGLELVRAVGPQLMASLGLELARAHGALSQADGIQPSALLTAMSGGLTQILLAAATAVGGLAAYRAVQE
jgi:hypothetical protein